MPTQYQQAGQAFFIAGFLLFSLVGVAALGLGLLATIQAFAPNVLGRAAGAVRHRGVLSPVAGVLIAGGLVGTAAVAHKVPAIAAIAVFDLVVFAVLGLVPFCEDLGRRLAWLRGREGSRVGHLATGWLVFLAASAVPFLGWFVILPFGLLSGLGSLLVGFVTPPDGPRAAPEI